MLRPRRKDGAMCGGGGGTRQQAWYLSWWRIRAGGRGHRAEYGQTKIITVMRTYPYIQAQCQCRNGKKRYKKLMSIYCPKAVKMNWDCWRTFFCPWRFAFKVFDQKQKVQGGWRPRCCWDSSLEAELEVRGFLIRGWLLFTNPLTNLIKLCKRNEYIFRSIQRMI